MSLRSIFSNSSKRTAVLIVACLALTVMISGCASMGGSKDPALVGTWDVIIDSQLGKNEATLTVGSDLTGNLEAGDLGTIELMNVVAEGNSASFEVTFDINGQSLEGKFDGTIDGDNISGEIVTDFGDATVTGTRQ